MSGLQTYGIKELANNQQFIFLIISLIGCITSVNIAFAFGQTPKTTEMQTYENSTLRIKIQHPSNWVVKEGFGSVLATLSPPSPDVSLTISKTPTQGDKTLKEIAEFQPASDTNYGDIIQSRHIKLNEKPAYMILYPSSINYKPVRIMYIITRDDSNQSNIQFEYRASNESYDNYISDVGNIIKSVKYTNNNLNSQILEQPVLGNGSVEQNVQQPASDNTGGKYKLIVYLDGAYKGNAIGDNFNIVVYDSDHKQILSAKPTIDFNDPHQKISPKKGYSIGDKTRQHPQQINVCAQQKYGLDGKTYNHDDCYPIKQNIQKTYWYTIFDYGEIDGYEGDLTQNTNVPAPSGTSNGNSIIMNATMR